MKELIKNPQEIPSEGLEFSDATEDIEEAKKDLVEIEILMKEIQESILRHQKELEWVQEFDREMEKIIKMRKEFEKKEFGKISQRTNRDPNQGDKTYEKGLKEGIAELKNDLQVLKELKAGFEEFIVRAVKVEQDISKLLSELAEKQTK